MPGAPPEGRTFGRIRGELTRLRNSGAAGRVSVIVPCHNNGSFVGEALESALDQSWRDLEVIVVDDGSSDDSVAVVSRFRDRVRCISQPRCGASAARNRGLVEATGEFIQFLDADDLLVHDAVRRRLEAFEGGTNAVFGDLEFTDHKAERSIRTTSHVGWPGDEPLADLIRNAIHTETPLHRRKLLYGIGGFDEDLPCSQELDLHIRLHLAGARFTYLEGIVARAREHAGPKRIENAAWYLEDPDLHMRIVEHLLDMVTGRPPTLPSPAVLGALAFKLWSRGVIAGRNGALGVARRYFERAEELSKEYRPVGSAPFRLVHRLFGPTTATWMLYQKKRMRDLLRAMP